MGILVLVLLVGAWGLVLAPTFLGKLKDPSPMDTEKAFHRTVRAVTRVGARKQRPAEGGRWVLVPRSPEYPPQSPRAPGRPSAAQRRARNISSLAAFCLVTFLLGMVAGPLKWMLRVSLAGDVLLVIYLAASMVVANRSPSARSPKRPPASPSSGTPAPFLHQPPEAAGGRR